MQITKEDFKNRLRQLDHDIAKIVLALTGCKERKELPTGEEISDGLKEIKHVIAQRFMDILGGNYIGNR